MRVPVEAWCARELRILADLLDRYRGDPDEVHAIAGRVEGVARDLRLAVARLDRLGGTPARAVLREATPAPARTVVCSNTLGGES